MNLRPLAAAVMIALAACSTESSDTSSTAGTGGASGTGGGVQRSGGVDTGGAAALRRALGEQGVGDRVLFGYDSAELTPNARPGGARRA